MARNGSTEASRRDAPRAVVVGAGPVGCMAATVLDSHGYSVTVYEKRQHFLRHGLAEEGRTINLSISPRGMRVLAGHCPPDEVRSLAVEMDRRVVHPADGPPVTTRYAEPDWRNLSYSRNDLTVLLMRSAETRPGVRFVFGMRCREIDVKGRRVFFDADDGRQVETGYDLLVGADGAHSTIRRELAAAGLLTFDRQELDVCYREFSLWPEPGDDGLTASAIHLWPRDRFFMVGLPNRDGSLRCTLVLLRDGHPNFADLTTDRAVAGFFAQHFPDAAGRLRQPPAPPTGHPVSGISVATCSALTYEDSLLLMGDAAHSVAPFLGQGVNLGLEDCLVLDRLLTRHRHDRAAALTEYDRLRRAEGDAATALSMANYVELTRGRSVGTAPAGPGLAPQPLPILVNFFDLSYQEVLQRYESAVPARSGPSPSFARY